VGGRDGPGREPAGRGIRIGPLELWEEIRSLKSITSKVSTRIEQKKRGSTTLSQEDHTGKKRGAGQSDTTSPKKHPSSSIHPNTI